MWFIMIINPRVGIISGLKMPDIERAIAFTIFSVIEQTVLFKALF